MRITYLGITSSGVARQGVGYNDPRLFGDISESSYDICGGAVTAYSPYLDRLVQPEMKKVIFCLETNPSTLIRLLMPEK